MRHGCLSCPLPAWRWCTGSCGWRTGWGPQTFCSCSDRGPSGDGPNVWTESRRSRQPARPAFLPVKHTAQRAVRTSCKEFFCWPEKKFLSGCLLCFDGTVTDTQHSSLGNLKNRTEILPANTTLAKILQRNSPSHSICLGSVLASRYLCFVYTERLAALHARACQTLHVKPLALRCKL